MNPADQYVAIVGAFSVVFSAFGAAGLTLWWQNRKEKRDSKLRVFTTLMMHRHSIPRHYDWVNALNLIDVVFADDSEVLAKWHSLYALFRTAHYDAQQNQHTYLEMLSAMAKVLGYKKLQQTDIEKFYVPQAHLDQARFNTQFQQLLAEFFAGAREVFDQQKSGFRTREATTDDSKNPPNA